MPLLTGLKMLVPLPRFFAGIGIWTSRPSRSRTGDPFGAIVIAAASSGSMPAITERSTTVSATPSRLVQATETRRSFIRAWALSTTARVIA